MVTSLLSTDDLRQARVLLEASGLQFETPYDDLVGIFEAGRMVAVGARQGRILKMLAVATSHQGGTLLDEVVTELVGRGYQEGVDSFFVFTSPALAPNFEALNFNLLAASGKTALLEYGDGLKRYLARYTRQIHPGNNGAIVANCNPFTLGHRYLVEQAAAAVDQLFLFVVREERSLFPFGARMRMVQDGTADLANVTVVDTSWYAVSSITFPTYFLKDGDPGGAIQMELDLLLFAQRIAPHFQVRTRFVGNEPLCGTTAAYNEAMHRILPPLGVEVREIERKNADQQPISASRVRDMLLRGELEGIAELVPLSTLDFLLSSEGIKIWVKGETK
ncbi:[citrate (pro-3S)-lyase] ligase [Geomonas subterranea]|uniref:[citrate (Pro-3S)-lyase] ligase n=1 Tax=Geomonas subterranea TaxID=2847989 RepID=A0ABX8LH49_9BACT|nr:[citrate (pro-3S)-lyase] ligase [Geomonas subterranea]QXE90241.1 [citrate (pro-3S)-lyase] ligase [Geomonas subterranea]QXM07633.1 [citrate (pro-3S)-lyase] ligase [Geomonas subterranea]